jgi:hypothetical protein
MIRATWAATAAVVVGMAFGTSAQGQKPGEPNPADRGGEFTVTGCVKQEAGRAGSPPVFLLTDVSAANAEGRAASAMGAGMPVGGAHSSTTPPSDPPDIVRGDYRLIGEERLDLPSFVNQSVQARGKLQDADAPGPAGAAGAARRVMVVTEISKVADTCTEVKGK